MTKKTPKDMNYPEMSFFMNESLSDVVFVVDGHRIPAIKAILSLKSPVFDAMFSGNFSESNESKESKLYEIEIKDTTVDAFKTMIRFIYTEQLVLKDNDDWQHICDVYQLSDRYEVLRLRQIISDHLESSINVSNLLSIGSAVFTLNIEELIQKLMAFIVDYSDKSTKEEMKNAINELNDSTNNRLFDSITDYLWKPNPDTLVTFTAFKTFIGLIVFNKLSFEDNTDFQLIRELLDIFSDESDLRKKICKHLKEAITVENMEQISGIAFDYEFDGLQESVISFAKENKDSIVWSNPKLMALIFKSI